MYLGMTVNERLFIIGLLDEFDKAISDKDAERAKWILKEVELTESNIGPILEKYGLKLR
jgi:molecular chaperone GrpE (heat shock protein)